MKPASGVSKQIARREFLRISSTAVVVTAAGTLLHPQSLFAATSSAFNPLLSIGYASAVPSDGSAASLSSADRVLMPDPAFISRGARVSVLGSGRAPGRTNAPGALFLDLLFPSRSGAARENRRFRFWSMAGHAAGDVFSSNMSFNVPVLATGGILLTARYRRPDVTIPDSTQPPPIEEDNGDFALSLGGAPGVNLATGVYVIALREPGDTANATWDGLRIVNKGGSLSVPNAKFAYVILAIDYADEKQKHRHTAG